MSYAEITRDDPNPLKRWLQRRRLEDALRLLPPAFAPKLVIDYGAGDGELSRRLAGRYPSSEVICFEPAPALLAQAAENLVASPNVRLADSEADLPRGRADLIVCTEVFEHLPPPQSRRALDVIEACLAPDGRAIIGVPVETGPPALAKGLFRWVRAPGERPGVGAVMLAGAGRPAAERLLAEIAPGRPYFPEHIGFDHRVLERRLRDQFELERRCGSPFRLGPAALNSEIYFVAARRAGAEAPVNVA